MTNKPVNIGVQCLATLFVPLGLYAFTRIHKLRLGIIIYGICYAMYIIATVYPLKQLTDTSSNVNIDTVGLISFFSVGLTILSFLLPIIFIRKWSKEYNNKMQHITH
jgi:uncharacterized membrane protein (DUF485 family)